MKNKKPMLAFLLILALSGCIKNGRNFVLTPPKEPSGIVCVEVLNYSSISNRPPLLKLFDKETQKWKPVNQDIEIPVGDYMVGIYFNNGINLMWLLQQGDPPAPETVQTITVEQGMVSIIRYQFKKEYLGFRVVFDKILPVEKLPAAYHPDAIKSALAALREDTSRAKQNYALYVLTLLHDPATIEQLQEIVHTKSGMQNTVPIYQAMDSIAKANRTKGQK